jgi:hypothetical protein
MHTHAQLSAAPKPKSPLQAPPNLSAILRGTGIHPKLRVGAVDDPLEREADHVADKVLLMSASQNSTGFNVKQTSRHIVDESEGQVQRKSTTQDDLGLRIPESVRDTLRSSGEPLDSETRNYFEPRFQRSFSDVRVHTNLIAQKSAADISAYAYTLGNNIVFAKGQLALQSQSGRRLIAHELAHVVQQGTVSKSDRRIARQPAPEVPTVLSSLSPSEIGKLRGFGNSDFEASLSTLEAHFGKTKGVTGSGRGQKFIDTRQAAGELRTFIDYVNNPEVEAIKVVPSATGGRSPDMYVRFRNRENARVEIVNITLASPDYRVSLQSNAQGQTTKRIPREPVDGDPGKSRVVSIVNDFNYAAVKSAIRAKINTTSKGPSQLVSQNSNTTAGGAPMTQGGYVVVQISNALVDKTKLDQIVAELETELVSSGARRIEINAFDLSQPRSGRKVFEYTRQGQNYVASVRQPNRRVELTINTEVPMPTVGTLASPNLPDMGLPASPVLPNRGLALRSNKPGSLNDASNVLQLPPSQKVTASVGMPEKKIVDYGNARIAATHAKFQGASMLLDAAIGQLDEIGKNLQEKEAQTKVINTRREIIDILGKEPGVGAVIELQFIEPEHMFQDVFWRRTTEHGAGRPTEVINAENRRPTSTFIVIEPVVNRKSSASTTAIGPAIQVPKEVKTVEEFVANYIMARGEVFDRSGDIAIEMYDSILKGAQQFGVTDVTVGKEVIRIPDAVRTSVVPSIMQMAEKTTRSRLSRLKRGIDIQQEKLTKKMGDFFGGAIKFTGHELDSARAHFAAAENYFKDNRFTAAGDSIHMGSIQVKEVWKALYYYDNGRQSIVEPDW